ncbi:GAF domain-containing sensor histidine kinase [Cohaesibacter celericrescens]|uniref:histidine kinase n=1 Tax=Cohaesibacter celericrescens TaxID=2067669 RepID=A0A2N5XMJ1_9HYPH|nr:ATP-binding protein [Cohaesibacter celericrescens]PLW75729.1 sensor histidine kinase [Cohaesibacter celericrescens]
MPDKPTIPANFTTEQVFNITRAIAGRVGYQAVIDAVSDEIQGILPHNHIDVVILDKNKENLVAYETGIQTEWGGINRKSVSTSPIRDILLGKVEHLITPNAMQDPRFTITSMFNKPIHDHQLRSRVHVQVRVAGELIGALSISSVKPDIYTITHVANAKLLSDLIGPYFFALWQSELVRVTEINRVKESARLEGLRTGARYVTDELESARAQIGMDLHDQTLADLSRIQRRLGSIDHLDADDIEALKEDLGCCLLDLRQIVDDAKPTVLEMFGLTAAVGARLERQIQTTRMPVAIKLVDQSNGCIDDLPFKMRITIYRILQEAGNNALRHSGCTKINVVFQSNGSDAKIIFSDNGRGYQQEDFASCGGLLNMKIRASLIGAEITFSRPGKSAELTLNYHADQ